MKRHELNRMFNALTPSPEREKALLEELLQNDTRRETSVKKWKRIAVCAAAAALLMACTVGAAAVASFFKSDKIEVTEQSTGFFFVSGGITYFPVDSLSDELKALEGQGREFATYYPGLPSFDSWERVEEFVGLDLMNNPVLDASAAEIPYSELESKFYDSRFVVMHDKDLRSIAVHGDYQIGEVSVKVDYDIFTDRSLELEERVRGTYYWYDFTEDKRNGVEVEEETYAAPNGLETVIVKSEDDYRDHRGTCLSTVSINGIRTTVSTFSPNGVKDARKVMIKVLDGFTP